MNNGGNHNWSLGQQVKHKSQEYSKSPTCLIITAQGEHPETHELFYNVSWMTDEGQLHMASVPQTALLPWSAVH